MNLHNFNLVLNQIKEHPETWYQKFWHSVKRKGSGEDDRADAPKGSCGTAHCFAGHAQLLAGKKRNDDTAQLDACIFLGLPPVRTGKNGESSTNIIWLFKSVRTMYDFEAVRRGNIEPVSGMEMKPLVT